MRQDCEVAVLQNLDLRRTRQVLGHILQQCSTLLPLNPVKRHIWEPAGISTRSVQPLLAAQERDCTYVLLQLCLAFKPQAAGKPMPASTMPLAKFPERENAASSAVH